MDWIDAAAKDIRESTGDLQNTEVQSIIEKAAEPLIALLKASKRPHDKTYLDETNDAPPCPLSYDDPDEHARCMCGADVWNAKIDAVLGGK